MPIVAVAAVAAILLLAFTRQSSASTARTVLPTPSDTPDPTTPATGGYGPVAVVGSITGVVKLAGQGMGGASSGSGPKPGGGSSLAVRLGGAAIAVGGALTWLQAHSTAGRAVGGIQTGAGVGTTIAPGIGTVIGAGIGAIAGWISGINANDTKQARWALAKELGWTQNASGFDKMIDALRAINPALGQAMYNEAVGRIGRKDTAWNNHFMVRMVHALQGELVHAYLTDPTKGGVPVI